MEEEKEVQTPEVVEEPKETPEPEPEKEPKDEEAPEVVDPPKPKKTAQERIDELTRKRRDAERDAEYWRAKALEKEPEKKPVEPVSNRPRLDQFETTEQYEDALLDWKLGNIERKKRQEIFASEQQRAAQTFQERAQKLREEHDDFDEVIEQPVFSAVMRDAFVMSENGPSVAYHLGTHPAEAERIRAMPAAMQLIEIGRLETKLSLAGAQRKTPSAPAPINPVGMGGGTKDKNPSEMSDEEWFSWKKEQEKKQIEERLRTRGRI